jgi:hypothetical protein
MIYIQYTDECPVFEYMTYSYLKVLKQKYENCQIIHSGCRINFKDDDIVIMILNWYEGITNNSTFTNKTKIYLFNIDTFINHSRQWDLCQKLGNILKQDVNILEYNPINVKYFNENNKFINIKILYLPLAYNTYYSDIFSKIKTQTKDIDVLFYGTLNDRRRKIINELSKEYKVVHIHPFNNYYQQCEYILRSKVVINIYYYDNNKVFDYFRLSNLISNDIFTITETPEDIDLEIEPKLIDYDKFLITSKYENFTETVKKYLGISEEERKIIAIKVKEWFKEKSNFEENLLKVI